MQCKYGVVNVNNTTDMVESHDCFCHYLVAEPALDLLAISSASLQIELISELAHLKNGQCQLNSVL